MKFTGIVRKIDEVGRIVVPKEILRTLNIRVKDPLEIYVDGGHIILSKYHAYQACHLTGEVSEQNIVLSGGKLVLSPEAAKRLVVELKKYLNTKR
ncbi:AbrB/MazE/SpoVT family DNA-binding domain-containing protein [Metabacillus arenae]|uniref:AbrB/MazE/SpoVT family DNA-binding domain-containing protein n=1 Tax=Metabacillus arenae TaxID=2771434 RepID=A0A926RYZ9_9BACI|nr:AbrB/MazE/SpoVT family DNA-binding domain-containing protein [Metabacillus arenae]MBD1382606.1 AbrB/MazE/SpoVT family DNA-binding domain-containing protein [Metabacillus arenae]